MSCREPDGSVIRVWEVGDLVSKRRAAEILNVNLRTVNRYVEEGWIAAVRLPGVTKIIRRSLDDFISARQG